MGAAATNRVIRFLVFAHVSCDETIDFLEGLFEPGSLTDEGCYGRSSAQRPKLNVFIESVEREHRTDP